MFISNPRRRSPLRCSEGRNDPGMIPFTLSSAPPNSADGIAVWSYKHPTPRGVKPKTAQSTGGSVSFRFNLPAVRALAERR
jgi:hypothetical protein